MTTPTTDTPALRLASKLLAASEKATPGPWSFREDPEENFGVYDHESRKFLAITNRKDNAALITLARNHAPEIARELLRAHAVVEAAEASLLQIAQRANESGPGPSGYLETIHSMHEIARAGIAALAVYRAGESAALDTERDE